MALVVSFGMRGSLVVFVATLGIVLSACSGDDGVETVASPEPTEDVGGSSTTAPESVSTTPTTTVALASTTTTTATTVPATTAATTTLAPTTTIVVTTTTEPAQLLTAEELAALVNPAVSTFLRADPRDRDIAVLSGELTAVSQAARLPTSPRVLTPIASVVNLPDDLSPDEAIGLIAAMAATGEAPMEFFTAVEYATVLLYEFIDAIPGSGPPLIKGGVHRIGDAADGDVTPGTYVTWDVDGCYWERQDASGEIIDNNFVGSANRVQVSISATDFGFLTENCGRWVGL